MISQGQDRYFYELKGAVLLSETFLNRTHQLSFLNHSIYFDMTSL